MKVRIRHRTAYHYDPPALLGPHVVRLRPADHARTALRSYNLEVTPADAAVRWKHNPWGAKEARLSFPAERPLHELALTVDAVFDVHSVNPFDFFVDDDARELPFTYEAALARELAPFLAIEPDPTLDAFVESVPFEGDSVGYLVALNQAVASRVEYVIRMEPGVWTPAETLTHGRGSCRDSALLLVAALRRRGLAARFVSGYLIQLADEGNLPDLAKGVPSDVVDLHAWCEVYVPGAGWIGLDGTSGLLCGEGHVPLAFASDPALAAPVTGTASHAAARFEFDMTIERLGHEPRPRRPYEDATWDAIRAAGDAVDEGLAALGIRLTCGGEPTWTSREAPHLPEWKTEALGESKRRQGLRFAEELRRRFGEGSVVAMRMGKQYPGESLPRWAIDILWRADGAPIWRDPKWLALAGPRSVGAAERAPSTADAERFGRTLAGLLGVPPALSPGFEDPWHFLAQEALLPPDVDPHAADLDDDEERRRLARALERGLGEPVGYALPLAREAGRWLGARWSFRRERLYLVPGDSPMGLRLPLEQLASGGWTPWYADATFVADEDPVDFDAERWAQARRARARSPEQAYAPQGARTALCIEPRDGVLHIFLPPVPCTEDFLELVAAIEETARETEVPVRLEGYLPPHDPRLRACTITPDPGVIEVNVPVSSSFAEYVALLELLTEAATHAGLSTEKYQLDGREVGSGGGNHLTLGGPSTIESPWLTRPHLLGGMLRYVQHHPSLSYLFTGLFIGPTSQAPRIDEARHDALHELELALAQLPDEGDGWIPPWLVDRLLRHLLADVSGNTHRTEICIDKLYDPHGVTGRLGLLELRAFEMPPHERMAAVEMLLVRAITLRLAKARYTYPLIPWGHALHDRFLLPHYLDEDARDVARDLSAHGVPFDAEWLRPFVDLRFPVAGTHVIEGVELEVRHAGEPWSTLGEQPAGSVVARYVDSSLERLEVRVRGLPEGERLVVAVNGWRLPLAPTGRSGEAVCGVRFRAWQPPFCLQPTIGVHHPLRFDLVDTWGRRSLGACTYHVWHPEGRAYDEPPLTAFEAKARRAQRFTTSGHAPYPALVRDAPARPEHPLTLDLRWCS
ncbi:MAG: transglutaminase family protein [Sandaracinaceae bacterium]|nr:transglutaminase family protein [Sandaracinaceae bacterium]